ncbi:MAG: type IV secretion system protein [Acidimicrobiia bacterium]|nr:type IV secretion system protein [Acidimicrobiia bacterium]
MTRGQDTARRGRRSQVLDGWGWVFMWLVAVVVVAGIVSAPPAHAQTGPAPGVELGEELYPPTDYPTSETNGIVGIGRYDIGCSNAGFVGDVACVTIGTATDLVFSIAKLLVAVAIWLLETAAGFVIEAALTDAATTVADLLDGRVLGPMRLSHLGLVVSALYMGFQFLRGRVGAGAGEFAVTLIVFAVLVSISTGSGFGGAVTATMQVAGGISAEIVSLAADTDQGGDISDRVGAALMAGFVRDPYDTINWGQPLPPGSCADARNQALASGPHSFDDTPRQLMEAAGCETNASFNAEASVSRLVGSLLYLVVAAAALALFVITAFTLVVAKGLALFLIALLPIALYAGLFPGAGRSLLWHWVAALVRVVALVIVMGVFLALLVTGLNGLLSVAGGMWTRFLLVIFFMAVMAVGRRQLLDISARFADSTLARLEGNRIGGSHGATWIRPYQSGGLTGLGVTHTVREAAAEVPNLPHKKPQPPPGLAAAAWQQASRRTPA